MIRPIHSNLLFLGNAMDARDLRLLYENQIVAVVDLAINEVPAQLAHEMIYCRFPIADGDGNTPVVLEMAIRCLIILIENEQRTLVACSAGMSRSPALAAAALAVITESSPEDCLLKIVAHAPHDVSPTLWNCVKAAYNVVKFS